MSRYKVNGEAREGSLGYQPYPNYKESGVAWLGEVPEHWEVGLLSSLFVDNKEKNAGMKNNNLLSLSYGRIIQKDIDTNEGLLPESFESYQIVHPGYIVLRLTDLQNDKKSLRTGFVKETGIITSAYTGLAKKSKSIGDERYFHLYLHTFDLHKGFYGMGAGVRQGLNFDELKKLKFLLPPTNEQTLIANFLDRETAKIDTLIAKQDQMIELLGEKRSALISHAVTKGINPNVSMKDSGVKWLGKVPKHWEIIQSRRLFAERKDRAQEGDEQLTASQKHGIVSQQEFMELEGRRVVQVITGSEILKRAKENDFVISMRSFQGGLEWCRRVGSMSSAYIALIPIKHVIPQFFAYLFKSKPYIQALQSTSNLVRDGQALRFENFSLVDLVIIPDEEQQAIADYLDVQTAKIDTLIDKARQVIELMKERRTALISAAVTGKIDVRGIH